MHEHYVRAHSASIHALAGALFELGLALRPTEQWEIVLRAARLVSALVQSPCSGRRLVLPQIEYRFHDATRAHVVQGGVGVF